MPDPARAAIDNHCAIRRRMAAIPGCAVEEDEATLRTAVPLAFPAFSNAVAKATPADPAAWLDEACDFYARHDVAAFSLLTVTDDRAHVEPALRARGFAPSEVPFLVMDPIDGASPPAGATFHEVSATDELDDNYAVVAQAFGFDVEAVALLRHRSLIGDGQRWFTGYVDGEPVCASALHVSTIGSTTVAGIWNVATIESHRRRGLGAAATRQALSAGVAGGCTMATLAASPLGRPVYQRMGFRPVATWDSWTRTASTG